MIHRTPWTERHVRCFGAITLLLESRPSTSLMTGNDWEDFDNGECEWLDLRLSILRDDDAIASVVRRGFLIDRRGAFRGYDGERDGHLTRRHRGFRSIISPREPVYIGMVREAVRAVRNIPTPGGSQFKQHSMEIR